MFKDWREKHKLSQSEAAKRLGLPRSYVCEVENGVKRWSLNAALKAEKKSKGELKAAVLLGLESVR